MTVDVEVPGAFTVDDVWRVPAAIRALSREQRPAALGRAREAAQSALTAILERVEVPMVWHDDGRLTFFPHDAADVAAVRAAEAAARTVHAHLAAVLRDPGVVRE